MAKLSITLKQHTPMIHFQGDQDGATLRATEVKPKLDKFLIKKVFNKDFNLYKKYLIGYKEGKTEDDFLDKKAFNYKIRFVNVCEVEKIDLNRKPFYFNDMGKEKNKDKNKFILYDTICMEVFSLNSDLLSKIRQNICGFFLINNFGFRQDKGYGSFYPLEGEDTLELLKKIYNNEKIFCYIQYGKKDNWKSIMEDADIIYKIMKSGINYPDVKNSGKNKSYHKGYLFTYMLDRNIGNEKRFIKENFLNSEQENKNHNEKYVRAMLGVADGIKFKNDYKEEVAIEYSSPKIERFQSPILFKIVDNMLFIIPQEIPSDVYDCEFIFSAKINSGKEEMEKKIFTPSSNEFSIDDFIEEFAQWFNEELKVDNKYNILENSLRKAKKNKIRVVR